MKEININELQFNPFTKIGKDWMLVTSTDGEKTNSMTASWGGLGVLWDKNVAFIVLRPQRYTKEFVDRSEEFSLSFFDDSFKKTLGYFGSITGRDEDKISKSGLHLSFINNVPTFEEASLVLTCKNLYKHVLTQDEFVDKSIVDLDYKANDYHTLYLAEITGAFSKD